MEPNINRDPMNQWTEVKQKQKQKKQQQKNTPKPPTFLKFLNNTFKSLFQNTFKFYLPDKVQDSRICTQWL